MAQCVYYGARTQLYIALLFTRIWKFKMFSFLSFVAFKRDGGLLRVAQ